MNYERVHIGSLITERMRMLGVSKSELARRINVANQHVNRMLERESIDTGKLVEVGKALDFNFFEYYRPTNPQPVVDVVSSKEAETLKRENELLKQLLEEKERTIEILMDRAK